MRQVRPGQHQPVHGAVERAGQQAADQRDRLPPPGQQQDPAVRDHRQDVARPVDAHHQGETERQAAERRQHPGRPAFGRQRVDDQAQPAQEQDLRQRLAVGRPAGELLGQGEREDQSRQRRPSRPGEPGGQPAEGEHRAGPEQRRHQDRRAHPAGPEPGRHDHRQPGHELRHHAVADLVEGDAVEVEQAGGVPPNAARACGIGSDPWWAIQYANWI